MPRDTSGRAVKDYDAEPEKSAKSEERKSDKAEDKAQMEPAEKRLEEHEKALDGHSEKLDEHHDRLSRIEDHLGLSKKADEMKSEDQKEKPEKDIAGHVTEKPGPSYARKRH